MGSLMVRKKGSMSTVAKVGVGLVACYVALHVLPAVIGAGIVVGFLGLAITGMIVSVITSLLSLALYVGVPAFALLFLISLFASKDD